MTIAPATWTDLRAELDAWSAAGLVATFWWRDDDAVAPTPALDRLAALAREVDVPLALAVIPAGATPALADFVAGQPRLNVLQHGWSHANHAPPGAKTSELGIDRPLAAVFEDLERGQRRLTELFGDCFQPALVPPWNRIAPEVVEALPGRGYSGLSTYAARRPSAGLAVVNTHIDPIGWRDGGGFVGEGAALGLAVAHLRARRTGDADRDEATGLMTHHLVLDSATWSFTEALLRAVRAHPAAAWVAPFGTGRP